jgi:hypothetical protein
MSQNVTIELTANSLFERDRFLGDWSGIGGWEEGALGARSIGVLAVEKKRSHRSAAVNLTDLLARQAAPYTLGKSGIGHSPGFSRNLSSSHSSGCILLIRAQSL